MLLHNCTGHNKYTSIMMPILLVLLLTIVLAIITVLVIVKIIKEKRKNMNNHEVGPNPNPLQVEQLSAKMSLPKTQNRPYDKLDFTYISKRSDPLSEEQASQAEIGEELVSDLPSTITKQDESFITVVSEPRSHDFPSADVTNRNDQDNCDEFQESSTNATRNEQNSTLDQTSPASSHALATATTLNCSTDHCNKCEDILSATESVALETDATNEVSCGADSKDEHRMPPEEHATCLPSTDIPIPLESDQITIELSVSDTNIPHAASDHYERVAYDTSVEKLVATLPSSFVTVHQDEANQRTSGTEDHVACLPSSELGVSVDSNSPCTTQSEQYKRVAYDKSIEKVAAALPSSFVIVRQDEVHQQTSDADQSTNETVARAADQYEQIQTYERVKYSRSLERFVAALSSSDVFVCKPEQETSETDHAKGISNCSRNEYEQICTYERVQYSKSLERCVAALASSDVFVVQGDEHTSETNNTGSSSTLAAKADDSLDLKIQQRYERVKL